MPPSLSSGEVTLRSLRKNTLHTEEITAFVIQETLKYDNLRKTRFGSLTLHFQEDVLFPKKFLHTGKFLCGPCLRIRSRWGSGCLDVNNDSNAGGWPESAFPATLACFSCLHHLFSTEHAALHLLLIPMETPWSLFIFCIFYMIGFKVAITYLFYPWPDRFSKANHQTFLVSHFFHQSWMLFNNGGAGIICRVLWEDSLFKSKYWFMVELLGT